MYRMAQFGVGLNAHADIAKYDGTPVNVVLPDGSTLNLIEWFNTRQFGVRLELYTYFVFKFFDLLDESEWKVIREDHCAVYSPRD